MTSPIDFPTDLPSIKARIQNVRPKLYGDTRNFHNGRLTYLSPYVSRGVISTRMVYDYIKSLKLDWEDCEKLIQELAWRDYWQQVWNEKAGYIYRDLKSSQEAVHHYNISESLLSGRTGIEAIDDGLAKLFQTGYMHNHMRMYVASLACNIGGAHWLNPAKWMYYHLLDGDLASNFLSWQWVAGSFSSKKYFANQENINKYFPSDQRDTFLDVGYDEFPLSEIPEELKANSSFTYQTVLPTHNEVLSIRNDKTLLYNYYNLDPEWHKGENYQRILILEPSVYEKFPISPKCLKFIMDLSENICELKVYVGEIEELEKKIDKEHFIYKQHPLNSHYEGIEESRDWISAVSGYYPSFFKFWKLAKEELRW